MTTPKQEGEKMRDERAEGCRYTAIVTLVGALIIGGLLALASGRSFMESYAWSAIGFLLGAIIWPIRSRAD